MSAANQHGGGGSLINDTGLFTTFLKVPGVLNNSMI